MSDYGSGYRDGKRFAALDAHIDLQKKEREIAVLLDALLQSKKETERLREALHRILHSPNGPRVYCRDGHEEAVLIARAALGEEK